LAALEAVGGVLSDVPAVACFDTAFHATLPAAAHTYALPQAWRERWGLRRYGFHGLAHASAARRAAELLGRPLQGLQLITCHLGGGASLAAVRDGHSVDTTMGFTPLDGLVMATRSGSVDPGLLLWLLEHTGLSEHEMAQALELDSGLLALAGDADMRVVLRGVEQGDPRAILALAVYNTCALGSPRWPPRWAASTRWSSAVASASTPPRCAPGRPTASGSSASASTLAATRIATATAT
jgi:acetate kinase